jgi:hypothetical protein
MGNIRTKNMRLLKLLDINGGREYVCINIYKYIEFLRYPIGNWNQSSVACAA